jgi:hypothetical protein
MEAIRRHITADPKPFLKLIRDTEKKTGIPISAELYKRPKETDDPKLAPFFAWKGNIACTRQEEFSPEVFGPDLAQRVADFLEAVTPLYLFFNQFSV